LFFFVAIHIWMLGNRWRSAFIVAIIANLCGFAFGLMTGSIATLVMNVVFCLLNFRAYLLWRTKDGEEETQQEI
jgi:hypothetical protein